MATPIVIELDLRNEPESLSLGFRREELSLAGAGIVLRIALRPDQRKALARVLADDAS